jgi:hypothetical protein
LILAVESVTHDTVVQSRKLLLTDGNRRNMGFYWHGFESLSQKYGVRKMRKRLPPMTTSVPCAAPSASRKPAKALNACSNESDESRVTVFYVR